MASSLKCPNPSCPFLFDPSQVPPGAVLTCPRCTMRFTLGPSAAGNAPPAESSLDFKSKKPAAKASEEAPAEPESKPSFFQSRAMLLIGLGACGSVVAAILALVLSGGKTAPVVNRNEKTFPDINFAINVPDGWPNDEDARKNAKANVLAIKKADSSARIAIAHHNFDQRNPQEGEKKDGIIAERLHGLFESDDLESHVTDGEWLGQKALRIAFRGRGKAMEGNFAGIAFAVGVHGRAYWFIAWALESEWEKVGPEIDAIRTGCRLIDPEHNWKPSHSGIETFTGVAAEYRILDGDGWWKKDNDPKDEDEKADLLLKTTFKSKGRSDSTSKAILVTYLLPGGEDPQGSVRSYAEKRFAKLFSIKQWNPLSGEPQGDPPGAGMPANADVMRFHAENRDSPNVSKLVVLNAISTANGIIGLEAYCPWSDRAKWEKRLVAIAASLQK